MNLSAKQHSLNRSRSLSCWSPMILYLNWSWTNCPHIPKSIWSVCILFKISIINSPLFTNLWYMLSHFDNCNASQCWLLSEHLFCLESCTITIVLICFGNLWRTFLAVRLRLKWVSSKMYEHMKSTQTVNTVHNPNFM